MVTVAPRVYLTALGGALSQGFHYFFPPLAVWPILSVPHSQMRSSNAAHHQIGYSLVLVCHPMQYVYPQDWVSLLVPTEQRRLQKLLYQFDLLHRSMYRATQSHAATPEFASAIPHARNQNPYMLTQSSYPASVPHNVIIKISSSLCSLLRVTRRRSDNSAKYGSGLGSIVS